MKSDDRRQIKYWAKTNDFTATHAVLGNYVLFIVTKQHPYYMVETHDAVMAQNLRELFKGFWDKIWIKFKGAIYVLLLPLLIDNFEHLGIK